MKKRQLIILSVSALALLLIVWRLASGKGDDKKEKENTNENKKFVKTHTIQNDTVEIRINGFGRVSSSRNITLTAEVQGVLISTGFELKPGETFSQGQLLYKINDREAQLALKARKSAFLNIMASSLADIKVDFPESASKWTAFLDNINLDNTLPELPEIKSSKEKTFLASRNVLTEYFNIKGDEERLKKYNVYAPFNGSVVDVTSEIGGIVNPGTPIATIIKTVSLEVAIPVNTSDISLVKIGNNVALFSQDKTISFEGKVSRIAQNINTNTQSIDVFISIESNEKGKLFNGMYLEASIYAGNVYDADEIPRRSLLNDGRVFIVQDSILLKKELTIVKKNKNTVIVRDLTDNDMVVIEPVPGAVDSMVVTPIKNK
ncbi:MAG: HlyD family efflux transporter periplasmic adaptor subunit [Flavobacteriales bacterium]|nr:HlyD family efflux transporter periplasmic adaptor subunit [Flavobacteriales bacterium]MCB9174248.1 HlyD family efflux transporter periplasmic adaptor subunit [Flavobacteriales bacterium]